jgi:hypothetical protein
MRPTNPYHQLTPSSILTPLAFIISHSSHLAVNERIGQDLVLRFLMFRYAPFSHVYQPVSQELTGNRPRRYFRVLDNDSLLNIFYHCRPVLLDEAETDNNRILQGGEWRRERWWYNLAHVCQRWRYLVLGSTSYLGLRLVCTHGTPVADMLAHSPPLPLFIDYVDKDNDVTVEDEDGMALALQQRDRVCGIRVVMPAPKLQKLIDAMDEEFPILEHLYVGPPTKQNTGLVLPGTFQAPHLRHFNLINFAFSVGSPLLTITGGLVTLVLQRIHPSAYVRPNNLV